MSLAYGTLISVNANEQKAIQEFNNGDIVQAAEKEASAIWQQKTVQFSNGTGPGGSGSTMYYITYILNGEYKKIIVTPDHCFLASEKKIKRASQLVPDVDQLVSANGENVEVKNISVGTFTSGVHDVAVDQRSGHWLIANGLISGDYAMQLNTPQDL